MVCRRERNSGLYEIVERKVGGAFALYGRFVSRHAWKIIIITVIVDCGLGIGMIKLKWDKDVKNVFLPKGSQAEKDEETTGKLFPDLSRRNFYPRHQSTEGFWATVLMKSTTGNLLERTILEEIRNFSALIENISITDQAGSMVPFTEMCVIAHSKCYIDGDIFWDEEFLDVVDNGTLTYPVFYSSTYGQRYYALLTGGKKTFDALGQYLRGLEYLKLDYYIRTDKERFRHLAPKWADAFIQTLQSYSNSHFEIAYGHFNSLDEELHKNIIGDIFLFAGTIALMMCYAGFATMSARCCDQIGQRMLLGITGVLAAGLALLGSFGLCSVVGIDFVDIVGVVPFLIIGIGIDDMFLLLSGLSESQSKESPEEKIAETMRISGVGVTITTLTDLIAFMAGVGSTFKAVRNFCIYTGVAVVFCYLNNITFFAACIVVNERRVEESRHYLTCRRIKTKGELTEEGKSKSYITCCGGRPPKNREEAESLIDKFPRWIIPKIVLRFPCKIIIIILFIGYIAGAVYGCINLKQGLLLTQLANYDSYFYKYSDWNELYFTRQTVVSLVIPYTVDYTTYDTQSKLSNLVQSAQSHEYFDENFEVNWLKSYSLSVHYNVSSKSDFIAGLLNFTSEQINAAFENDVVIDEIANEVTASRVYVLSSDLAGSQEEGKMMLESRGIAAAARINCYALSPYFVYFEQYVLILKQTLQSVGIALAAVFVVTCIFMPHPVLVFFVTIVVLMIMTGVFGYMFYIDVALSAITMIQLIMSIGFSVDFTAHICHGFVISPGETRAIKVQQAIDKTGAPIFHGALSSIIGIVVLNAAESYIFRTFAAVLSFVLFFGISHALLLLPVVLSCVGPLQKGNIEPERTSSLEQHNPFRETEASPERRESNASDKANKGRHNSLIPLPNKRTRPVLVNGSGSDTRLQESKSNLCEEEKRKKVEAQIPHTIPKETSANTHHSANPTEGFVSTQDETKTHNEDTKKRTKKRTSKKEKKERKKRKLKLETINERPHWV